MQIRQSKAAITLTAVILATVALLLYQWLARAVIFDVQPADASVKVKGLAFGIGKNYLLLPDSYQIEVRAEGYYAFEDNIIVSDQPNQTFDFQLQPLPGNLRISSDLDNISVSIDDQPRGTVPGLIEGLSRGPHLLTLSKYRYFPESQQVDIRGLGETQELQISLRPAWGQMSFDSSPQQANFYVDDQLVGTTPLTTEILETGSTIRLELAGYQTHSEVVRTEAGSSAEYPPIALQVANGQLRVESTPSGANLLIGGEFVGLTPLTVELAPFKVHQLALFKPGYLEASREVSVQPQQRSELALSLAPNIGTIELTVSPPDADVAVDGEPRGQGGGSFALSAVPHRITVSKPGYQSKSVDFTPKLNQKQAVSIALLTNEEAYWKTKPSSVKTAVGSTLKLFRPQQTFTMGAPRRQPGRRANEVQRQVRLERPFYLGTTEVSNGELRRWRDHSSSSIRGNSLNMDSQPAVNISWQQAALYCNWLSQQQGLPPFYQVVDDRVVGFNWQSHGYRLPTEAEWAWAAKIAPEAGSTVPADQNKLFPWQSNLYPPTEVTDNYGDQRGLGIVSFTMSGYDDGYGVAAPVGSYQPNSKGLYNMSGNVSEWVNDYYDPHPNSNQILVDPRGPQQGNRYVARGASWAKGSRSELRLSYRDAGTEGRLDLGFRIARYVDSPEAQP